MFLAAGSTAGDNGYGQRVSEFAQGLVGIAVLRAIVVHRGEENFSGSTFLSFLSPFKESTLSTFTTTFQIAEPPVFIQSGVNGHHTYLRAKARGDFIDQFRTTQCG